MFNNVAEIYDETFTNTEIGKLQRKAVWDYIDKILPENKKLNILELNCGTGEDAIYIAQKGHEITATDISEEMIKITKQKVDKSGFKNRVKVLQCDMRELENCNFSEKYDFVFSNFGGLNCLNHAELQKLSDNLKNLLVLNGRLIAVIMPKFCLMESLYFLTKFDFKKVFRRNTNSSIPVNVGDNLVETFYYSPKNMIDVFQNNFKKVAIKPIGISVPPSYLEPLFLKRKKLLNVLGNFENHINEVPGLSYASDHYLIDLMVK